MANVMRGNRQCTTETLKEDFMKYSQELIEAKAELEEGHELDIPEFEEKFIVIEALTKKVLEKERKVDSVLDLAIDLGFAALESANEQA